MENQNVLGTIEKGGKCPESVPESSRRFKEDREKIICNSRWLLTTSSVTTVDVQRGFKPAALKLPPFVIPHCSVWLEPFLKVRGFCRTHSRGIKGHSEFTV